ncbi:hypothetical protein J3R30DRAFT_3288903, partial [Lentinula aciculospora]
GDLVAVNHGFAGQREGIVVGTYFDDRGRQFLEIRLDSYEMHHAWYPTVKRITRTVYNRPAQVPLIGGIPRTRTVERKIYW